jgi:hypothetical protein
VLRLPLTPYRVLQINSLKGASTSQKNLPRRVEREEAKKAALTLYRVGREKNGIVL